VSVYAGGILRRILLSFALVLIAVIVALAMLWATLALWFRLPVDEPWKTLVAFAVALLGLAIIGCLFTRHLLPAFGAFGAFLCGVLLWWSTILPPALGNFAPDVSRQVTGVREGEQLTLTNVRNFAWRSDADFTPLWETRSYNLIQLRSLDLFLSHWDGPNIAHMIMSFGFSNGEYLAWSVEVRRRMDGAFSPLDDLFKSNPLVVIAADERDVIGVRSNVRREDVHRYRLNLRQETLRTMLLEYVAQANGLAKQPAFYNSLTTNCTTTVVNMMRAVGATLPLDWRLIINGRLPDYAFDAGALDGRFTLSQLKARAPIGERALRAGISPEFSQAIRAE
jgi:Domain of unknown function (DUF4105)